MFRAAKRKIWLQSLILASTLPAVTQLAHGNGLAVTGDSVTISASAGGFNQAKDLSATAGLIPDTDSIPTASISSDLTFTFDLQAATGKTINTGGNYSFSAGMFLDQDGSSRRLEISISNISITFDANGNIVSGSVAAGNNASVSGRSADGSLTANIAIPNNLLNFTDTSLQIRAGAQISDIQGSADAILQDLTTTFTAAASYSYGVFLKQTGGPEGMTFGLVDGTAFGCPASNPMVLASQTNFAGASGLQGRMGIGQAAGGTAPTVYSGTCVTSPAISSGGGGGGGGGDTTTETPPATETPPEQPAVESAATQTTAIADQIASGGATAETATNIANLTAETATTATNLAADLAAGNASVEQVSSLVGTLAQQMSLAESTFDSIFTTQGASAAIAVRPQIRKTFLSAFLSIRALIKALPSASLAPTSEQLTAIRDNTASTLNSTRRYLQRLISSAGQSSSSISSLALTLPTSEDVTEVSELIQAASDSTDATLSLAGSDLSASLSAELAALSQAAIELTLDDLATQLGTTASFTSDAAAQSLLASNPTLLARLASLVLIDINDIDLNQTATSSALQTAGLPMAEADALSAKLAGLVNASEQVLDTGSGAFTLNTALDTFLSVTSSTDSLTNTVALTSGSMTSHLNVMSVSIAPSSFPAGTHVLPDGSSLHVTQGLVIKTVPALANIVTFAGAVASANAALTYNDDGSLLITGSDFTFTGRPGDLPSTSGMASTVSVLNPTGSPADPAYAFTLDFGGGTSQQILPVLRETDFFEELALSGLAVATDTNTGIVTVTLDGTDFRFKPDFFSRFPTFDDISFRSQSGNTNAAFRPVDANGDAITDYRVIIGNSVQVLYGLP